MSTRQNQKSLSSSKTEALPAQTHHAGVGVDTNHNSTRSHHYTNPAAASASLRASSKKQPQQQQVVRLQSADGDIFSTTLGVARLSSLLRSMLLPSSSSTIMHQQQQQQPVSLDEDEVVPLASVASDTLKLVLEFCEQHEHDALAFLTDAERNEAAYLHAELGAWDRQFLERLQQGQLFELMLAASSHLDIPLLTDVCCKFLATSIRGKPAQQLREQFNIRGDMTPEEEQQVMKEFGFATTTAAAAAAATPASAEK